MSKRKSEVGLAPEDFSGLLKSQSASPTSPKLLASRFVYSSIIPAPLEKVWALYADVNTINQISPFLARVNFERVDLPLRAGSEIIFVGKYPPYLRWHARIVEFVSNSHFVDVQVAGPFEEWRHEHIFKARGDATEMIDQVTFRLNGGEALNKFLAPLVNLLLRAYFSFRYRRTRILLQK
jgi:ligand-binding SRPBCC domain-containing protein